MLHAAKHRQLVTQLRSLHVVAPGLTSLKFLGDYLAQSLTPSERLSVLLCHYETIARLSADTQAKLSKSTLIWSKQVTGHPSLEVYLQSAGGCMEGELRLRVAFGYDLYRLTFVFGPGEIAGTDCSRAIYIGEIKGAHNSKQQMREASRINHEISPRSVLMLAVQALARALDIPSMCVVSAQEQIASARTKVQFDYSLFSREIGAEPRGRFDVASTADLHKPLEVISPSHRSRARRRREAKAMILRSMHDCLCKLMTG